jgi:hypothetical protein
MALQRHLSFCMNATLVNVSMSLHRRYRCPFASGTSRGEGHLQPGRRMTETAEPLLPRESEPAPSPWTLSIPWRSSKHALPRKRPETLPDPDSPRTPFSATLTLPSPHRAPRPPLLVIPRYDRRRTWKPLCGVFIWTDHGSGTLTFTSTLPTLSCASCPSSPLPDYVDRFNLPPISVCSQ